MWQNTKLLISFSIGIVFFGLGLLWFGLKPSDEQSSSPSPTPFVEITPVATSSATQGLTGEKAIVINVVDGDTIELHNGKTVRFIGIDTPETVDPRRAIGCFGKEAGLETKDLLNGKEVIMQKDVSETDKYGRLLRYVFLPLEEGQILFVNDYLVRKGFATVVTFPPDVKFNEQFRLAEQEAREYRRGLWGKCESG